jgi:uroporphyrin-III C-methyltransferase
LPAGCPGKVWFVGAGPGSEDLLTVRALRVLARADVVLHDALVPAQILRWARAAVLVAVGKRCDRPSAGQRDIDRALVAAARRHASVVRLKGGDPAVFGRLDEEIDALQAAGIPWEVVPGVTAASAAAAAAGQSLTRRGDARRVTIVTPRTGRGQLDNDCWADGLDEHGTVVLYMAGRVAASCAQVLLDRGFGPDVPVVAVRAASLPRQDVRWTTLAGMRSGFFDDGQPVALLIGRALADRRPAAAHRGGPHPARDLAELAAS